MTPELILKAGPRALTRDVPLETRKELRKQPDFMEAAKREARQRYVAMHLRQIEIARDLWSIEHKHTKWGRHYMRIDGEVFETMMALYGNDCWSDDEFIEAVHRDMESTRVISTRGANGQQLITAR